MKHEAWNVSSTTDKFYLDHAIIKCTLLITVALVGGEVQHWHYKTNLRPLIDTQEPTDWIALMVESLTIIILYES